MTNLQVRSIDVPQLFRYGVGFDRMFDRIDEVLRINQANTNYPPYNLIRVSDDQYLIEVAVAGFKQGEVSIEVKEDELTIEGKHTEVEGDDRDYVHRGISGRNFTRIFKLAEHVEVVGACQENGVLSIQLERKVPEAKKPKQIAITYNI